MRGFITKGGSFFERVLLIESAPRDLGERALQQVYKQAKPQSLDVLTCFDAPPQAFDFERGVVFSVHDEKARNDRSGFIGELCATPYTAVILLVTGSRILDKWKWLIAARTPAKLVMLDERANLFPVDLWNLRPMQKMAARRLNPFRDTNWDLPEASIAAFAMALLAPFKLFYLGGYAARVHLGRWFRMRRKRASFAG